MGSKINLKVWDNKVCTFEVTLTQKDYLNWITKLKLLEDKIFAMPKGKKKRKALVKLAVLRAYIIGVRERGGIIE
jgi:hypothetical protein